MAGSQRVGCRDRAASCARGVSMLSCRASGSLHRKLHVTAHGFRSSFRDWAAEQTSFPREVCEMALAHAIENKVEAAYRRSDLFEKRRELMTAWEQFASSRPDRAA